MGNHQSLCFSLSFSPLAFQLPHVWPRYSSKNSAIRRLEAELGRSPPMVAVVHSVAKRQTVALRE